MGSGCVLAFWADLGNDLGVKLNWARGQLRDLQDQIET